MKRIHTYKSIADERNREKRTVQGWYDKARKDGHELGEMVEGARKFSDEEKRIILSYAGGVPSDFIKKDEMAIATTSEVLLPESFSPSAMVARFDGAIGVSTDPEQIVALTRAIVGAGLETLNTKIAQQSQSLLAHQSALAEAQQVATEGFMDLKVKASESKQLANQQTLATQQLQALLGKLTELGQTPSS